MPRSTPNTNLRAVRPLVGSEGARGDAPLSAPAAGVTPSAAQGERIVGRVVEAGAAGVSDRERGKMRCPVHAFRDCIPVNGPRKRYCRRVASGECVLSDVHERLA